MGVTHRTIAHPFSLLLHGDSKCAEHLKDHSVKLLRDAPVCKPKHLEASPLQVCVSLCIRGAGFWQIILNAINLDDQPLRQAREIYDIPFDWYLPAEVEAVLTERTQLFP